MKSDEEFLDEMWNSISLIEYEERQKQLVFERDRLIKRQLRKIHATFTIIFLLIVGICFATSNDIVSVLITSIIGIAFIFVFIFENKYFKEYL